MTLADVCVCLVSKSSLPLYRMGPLRFFFKALVISQMIYESFTHVS